MNKVTNKNKFKVCVCLVVGQCFVLFCFFVEDTRECQGQSKSSFFIPFSPSKVNVENFLEEVGQLTSVDIVQAFEKDVADGVQFLQLAKKLEEDRLSLTSVLELLAKVRVQNV